MLSHCDLAGSALAFKTLDLAPFSSCGREFRSLVKLVELATTTTSAGQPQPYNFASLQHAAQLLCTKMMSYSAVN